MLASILVATPHAAFGELLRISLEDSGQYQVRLVLSAREVRASADRGSYQLAILDSGLNDEPFIPLCMDLLELQKGIRLIVVPPDNNPNHPSLGGLLPHGYLSRPFYLPDLMETVTRLLSQRSSELHSRQIDSVTLPPWLQEPLILQGYLEKELLNTQALAAIVGLHGPAPGSGTLRAIAGQLSESAGQEMGSVVFRYWNRDEKTDLMRFIRLAADKKDYLIYATQLTGDLVLMLVYDTTAPLSQIRPQTKNLAQTLTFHPPEYPPPGAKAQPSTSSGHSPAQASPAADRQPGQYERTLPDVQEPPAGGPRHAAGRSTSDVPIPAEPIRPVEPVAEEEPEPPFLSTLGTIENQSLDPISRERDAFLPYEPGEFDQSDNGHEAESINLSALLGAVPAPDADKGQREDGWTPEPPTSFPPRIQTGALNGWRVYEDSQQGAEQEKPAAQTLAAGETLPVKSALPVQPPQPEHRPGTKPPGFDLNLAVQEEIDSLEDTRPHIVAALTSLSQLEPSSPALSQLNYTCVLIPRLPQHYLTGELADRLAYWVHQLCLAFGWRLEGISIRPEYLQWTVQVSPSISPGNLIRIVRQRTSLHIFNQFTHFNDQNPSGDFWATGYLIVSGAQPPSAQLLRDYILQTRKRQGVIK